MVWFDLKKNRKQNVKSREQHSKSVFQGNFRKSVDGKIFKIFLQACSKCSQPGIHTASWPFHLLRLLIMAALWSAPPCKDIAAPIQRSTLHLSQFSAEQREKGFRRKSKTIYRDRQLDFLLSGFFSFLFGLSGFTTSTLFFFFSKKSWC